MKFFLIFAVRETRIKFVYIIANYKKIIDDILQSIYLGSYGITLNFKIGNMAAWRKVCVAGDCVLYDANFYAITYSC